MLAAGESLERDKEGEGGEKKIIRNIVRRWENTHTHTRMMGIKNFDTNLIVR